MKKTVNFYDVVIDAKAEPGQQDGGTVHHSAFRTPTEEALQYRQKKLMDSGFPESPIRDRKYFKSIYFHEPGGGLYEFATDLPASQKMISPRYRSITADQIPEVKLENDVKVKVIAF